MIMRGEVPQNIEYINLKLRPYGYKSSFKVLLEGKEITQDYLGRYNITPDWENKDEYTLSIEILENNDTYCQEDASYIVTIKKGGIDYTPDVTFKEPFTQVKTLHLGETPIILSVKAVVPGSGEGKFTYQWYYVQSTEKYFNPIYAKREEYKKIEGATDDTYIINADEVSTEKCYCCEVTYE